VLAFRGMSQVRLWEREVKVRWILYIFPRCVFVEIVVAWAWI
jgi:hypothetical protein